ncbi:DUF2213 domain-containing protein [Pectinatus haikarae]|uniref:DUF2213 domain-containing protein n=1 Tax=Pectinatus haikarae TaxID=349096 RepID=UPI0027D8BBEE|nr:DUF2213 domain-containing protein [Pectinatus haikarae]
MKAFYGDRISEHMTKTPEGFLICHDVPISRTGIQQYCPRELGLDGDEMIPVKRTEDVVFSSAAIASFEGKPVTDDHPPVDVNASNYNTYMRGAAQNIHRGNGADSDKLFADLIIHDANLISEIEAGKREISCGYDCKYADNGDGTYSQIKIIGNHIAVVDAGRAGHGVAIKDSKPKEEKRKMPKNGSILQRMFAVFVKDADPTDIQEAAKAVDAVENGTEAPVDKPAVDAEPPAEGSDIQKLTAAVAALTQKVESIIAAEKKEPEHKDDEISSLDALENELGPKKEVEITDEPDESSVTIEPEQIQDEDPSEEEKPEHVAPANGAADRMAALNMLRIVKPIVAAMPDGQRRKVSDQLSKAVRDAMQVKSTQSLPGGYATLTTRKKAQDALTKQGNPREYGENCRKRNPHYKEEK